MRLLIILLLLSKLAHIGIAQPDKSGMNLSNQTKFRDGIYKSLLDFQRNSPSFPLKSIDQWDYQVDADTNELYLSAQTKAAFADSEMGGMDNVWGFSIQGVPYVKVSLKEENQTKIHFVRLYIIGNISYYYYKIFVPKRIQMNVYHPYTGTLMGMREVMNKERLMVEKMLRTATGETDDFNLANFKKWIADDSKLLKTLEDLPDSEAQTKLFKTLMIYNDRNPQAF